MDLLSEIAFIVDTHQHLKEVGNELLHKESLELAAEILSIPAIAEALRELELRKRVEKRLAGTMDERPFIDGNPLGKPNA